MNQKITILLASTIPLLAGILLFSIHHQWIILRFTQMPVETNHRIYTKRACQLSYWYNNRWHTDSQELIWSTKTVPNLTTLIATWLSLLDAEQIIPKKTTLQSIALSPNNQTAYISFDRNILPKQWSIYQKWMLIEGLLKTIRFNEIAIRTIQLLIHHQPICDVHLDLSFEWPVSGFMPT